MRLFFKLVYRDINLVIKGASDTGAAILFYLLAIIVFLDTITIFVTN